jgi:hypothetical protein
MPPGCWSNRPELRWERGNSAPGDGGLLRVRFRVRFPMPAASFLLENRKRQACDNPHVRSGSDCHFQQDCG